MHKLVMRNRTELVFLSTEHKSGNSQRPERFALVLTMLKGNGLLLEYLRTECISHIHTEVKDVLLVRALR